MDRPTDDLTTDLSEAPTAIPWYLAAEPGRLNTDHRLTIFETLLRQFPRGHLLDLAAGHGRFSALAEGMGWSVTAVDVRTERRPREEHPGIRWIQSDVRDYEIGDEPDVIAILGLLYHLELDAQLELLARCSHRPTILDTHHALRPIVREGDYDGRPFAEDVAMPTASWGNVESFWPTEESLTRMLFDAGYATVLRSVPAYLPDRTFWLCLPADVDPERLVSWRTRAREAIGGERSGLERELAEARTRQERLETELEECTAALSRARAEVVGLRRSYERLAGHPAVRTLRRLRGALPRRTPPPGR